MLVISAVWPFPGNSGQERRVYYKLKALREHFRIDFLTFAPADRITAVESGLNELCDAALVLPSLYSRSRISQIFYQIAGRIYAAWTGLKVSNYLVGKLELAPDRLQAAFEHWDWDLVLFEYWHTADATPLFRSRGIPCVLDMHNLLWQSFARQLDERSLPAAVKKRLVDRYRVREESAWRKFDALIAINRVEGIYTRERLHPQQTLFYAPMGTDLRKWAYSWKPVHPQRLAYYGGLGSSHNQQDALLVYEEVMPRIWQHFPEAEYWIVGSHPPDFLHQISARDLRVKVTGFVEDALAMLSGMSVLLCPWSGTYGFRSRLIEAMSVGVPVIATPSAVYGMDLENGNGLWLEDSPEHMAERAVRLLLDPVLLAKGSRAVRGQVEAKFSFEATYGLLADELSTFARVFKTAKGN